ncbi:ATP phosphoribosyltransferase [Aureibacillus halotolerans]|uniref:ATP phosphoribosyltransferase n=1 Tax=Aureibacillus halotolerans TaxID=1508390 RepID=A0A4R6TY67_9BACI|nr:ATP phosphoribosyltransferase [Aureibacillus halotolerans]TDQ36969.1 ATP phosphoribosyltransferase catalytic subunit [Aureibacillus halotolerans]
MRQLTIAMPKGRIFEEALDMLRTASYNVPPSFDLSRKLLAEVKEEGLTFILAKPSDVPVYVEHGVADVGIAGKDVLLEEDRNVYEVLDLGISRCHLSVAGLPGAEPDPFAPKVATKYPRIASDYFREQGEQVEIIKLNGSIELAPMIGLAERIVDIVSTGKTLKENGLVELETIRSITSRLIVNPVSYRLKDEAVRQLTERLQLVVQGGDGL